MKRVTSIFGITALVGASLLSAQGEPLAGQVSILRGPIGPDSIDSRASAGLPSPVEEADALYFANDPLGSFEVLEAYLEIVPADYESLWRAARAGVLLGVAAEGSRLQNRWLDPAMDFGHRAVAVRPEGTDGRYWRGAAHGRRAMNASPGYASELAQQVWDDAHAILAIDSLHGGAHNLLGKLSYEVMSLSRFERAIGRVFMGNEALSGASWELAEFHLEAAATHWPELVLFHFDLGLLHRKRGNDEQARAAFQRALEAVAAHPTDLDLQARAREYLAEMGS